MTSRTTALSLAALSMVLARPVPAAPALDDGCSLDHPISSRCFTSEGEVRAALSDLAADLLAGLRNADGLRVVATVVEDAAPLGRCFKIEIERLEAIESRPSDRIRPPLAAPVRREFSTRIAKRGDKAMRVDQWVEDDEGSEIEEAAEPASADDDSALVARPAEPIESADPETATVAAVADVLPLVFAIAPARNPTAGDPFLALALPEPSAVRLEMFDVAGRRTWGRRYGRLEAGHHQLPIGDSRMAAGVYWVRAWQSDAAVRTAKIVVTR